MAINSAMWTVVLDGLGLFLLGAASSSALAATLEAAVAACTAAFMGMSVSSLFSIIFVDTNRGGIMIGVRRSSYQNQSEVCVAEA